jgi:hypothetical protein
MSVEYVVTLVHGTWARNASWTDESSSLCRGLRDGFPPSSVIFERFQWSGRNSFSARRKATNGLAAHMKRVVRKWPNARHYIIAHSHGGNIALYALRDNEVNRAVAGIVCLATPFLHARPRDLGPHWESHLMAMSVILCAVFFGLGVAILSAWFPILNELPDFVGVFFSAIGVVVVTVVVLIWEKWGGRLLQQLSFPNIEPNRLLIVRTIGDEAQAALAGAQVIGWLSMRIWRPIGRLSGKAMEARGVWRIVLMYPGGLLAMLAALLLIPLVVLLSILLFAFGPDLALASPFVDIAIEFTPQDSWMVHQQPSLDGQQLSHSQSYEDPRTVALIASWIKTGGVPPRKA